jgi:hypothetical protein
MGAKFNKNFLVQIIKSFSKLIRKRCHSLCKGYLHIANIAINSAIAGNTNINTFYPKTESRRRFSKLTYGRYLNNKIITLLIEVLNYNSLIS